MEIAIVIIVAVICFTVYKCREPDLRLRKDLDYEMQLRRAAEQRNDKLALDLTDAKAELQRMMMRKN